MSGPVDVLAVIDREIDRAGGEFYSDGRDLIKTRAAVAELIEAFERIINTGIDERTFHEYMSQPDHYARAALSRVKGESQ